MAIKRSKSSKKGVLLFIGAGASMGLGLPDTRAFMELLHKEVEERGRLNSEQKQFLTHIQHFIKKKENISLVDIEYVVNYLYNIQTFYKEFKEFFKISSRYTPVDKFLREATELLAFIEQILLEVYDVRSEDQTIKMAKEAYRPFITSALQSADVLYTVTTNYDLVLDLVLDSICKEYKVAFIDGFSRDRESKLNINQIKLSPKKKKSLVYLKLHGSIDWYLDGSIIRRLTPGTRPYIPREKIFFYPPLYGKDPLKDESWSVYGEATKEIRKLYTKFEKILEQVKTAIVIGFSFRDRSINDIFKKIQVRNFDLNIITFSKEEPYYEGSGYVELKKTYGDNFVFKKFVFGKNTLSENELLKYWNYREYREAQKMSEIEEKIISDMTRKPIDNLLQSVESKQKQDNSKS